MGLRPPMREALVELVERPAPRRRGAGSARSVVDDAWRWIVWIGPARVIGGIVAAAVLVALVLVAVRVPTPPQPADRDALPSADGAVDAAPVFTLPPLAPVGAPVRETVIVHVAGAVARPGVHELATGSRVVSAIDAAGGPTAEAQVDALNLAAELVDGQRIYVPVLGEVVVEPEPFELPGSGADVASRGPLDLNRATVDDLVGLPGVGPVTAEAIVADRERRGPFVSVDDLMRVRGIGPAKLAAIRDLVVV